MARLRSRVSARGGLREFLIDQCREIRVDDETWEAWWHPYRRRLAALESGDEVPLIADWELLGWVSFSPVESRWYRLTTDDRLVPDGPRAVDDHAGSVTEGVGS